MAFLGPVRRRRRCREWKVAWAGGPEVAQSDDSKRQIHSPLTLAQHCRNTTALPSDGTEPAQWFELKRKASPLSMELLAATDNARDPNLIYVVEDDPDVSRLIEYSLRNAGYEVSTFFSSGLVVSSAARAQPALFLLDIMLPEMNGFDLCRQIRQHERLGKTPVIFLSAKTQEPDRLQAFDVGGDGYISKPFSPRELVARVRNLLRALPEAPGHEVIRVGELEIDVVSMTVRVQGSAVLTTVREFRLLEYLARHRGRVFTRDQLLDAVWKEGSFVTPRSIDVFVRRLREKIEPDPRHPRYLKTLRGIGYRFEGAR
jgi:two-component system phosphate regulon response regulator PhoB